MYDQQHFFFFFLFSSLSSLSLEILVEDDFPCTLLPFENILSKVFSLSNTFYFIYFAISMNIYVILIPAFADTSKKSILYFYANCSPYSFLTSLYEQLCRLFSEELIPFSMSTLFPINIIVVSLSVFYFA